MPEPWRPTGNFKCGRGFFGTIVISIEEQRQFWETAAVTGYQPARLITQTRWRTARYKDLLAICRAFTKQETPQK